MYRIFFLFTIVFSLSACSPGTYSPFGTELGSSTVERSFIDNRITYIKSYQPAGDELETLRHYTEMFLRTCKRAEDQRQTDYLVDRMYHEINNPHIFSVLLYAKKGYIKRRSEVYDFFNRLEKYPGMKDKLFTL